MTVPGIAQAVDRAPARRPATSDESAFLRGLVGGLRCGVLAIDRNGRIVLLNEIAREILGLHEPPAAGAPAAATLAAHPALAELLDRVFELPRLPSRAELALGPDGRGTRIGFTISIVGGDGDAPLGAAVFFKDLTSIEHREAQERLRGRLVALGEMAASMAHEIRNPLAAIEVNCALLRRRLADDVAGRTLIDKVTHEVGRLNHCVTTSLEYVRPVALELTPTPLEPLLDEAIEVAMGRVDDPRVRIVRRDEQPVPSVSADAGALRQVFVNLLINAIEAVETAEAVDPWVDVTLRVRRAPRDTSVPYAPLPEVDDPLAGVEQLVEIRIADNGPGIAPDELGRVFDPFFTTKPQGSGVGLAVSKKIVATHHGLIDCESEPGRGAVFTIRLPILHPFPEVRGT